MHAHASTLLGFHVQENSNDLLRVSTGSDVIIVLIEGVVGGLGVKVLFGPLVVFQLIQMTEGALVTIRHGTVKVNRNFLLYFGPDIS